MAAEKFKYNPKTERLRWLLPIETWRLMGFEDSDYEACERAGVPRAELFKQSGNSIVVQVLEAIFKQMIAPDSGLLELDPLITRPVRLIAT